MEKRMNKEELVKLIESLKLDKNEYWILSSGALVLRGIYPDAGDLDIAVTEKGLKELKGNYNLKKKENGWYIVNDKIECVLDNEDFNMGDTIKISLVPKDKETSIEDYYAESGLKPTSTEKEYKAE